MTLLSNEKTNTAETTLAPERHAQPSGLPLIVESLAQPLPSGFTLKAIKTFMGRGGYGLTAKLVLGKEPVAEIIDEGNGSATHFRKVHSDPAVWSQFEAEAKAWFAKPESLQMLNEGLKEPIFGENTDPQTMLGCWVDCFVDLTATDKKFSKRLADKFVVKLENPTGEDVDWFGVSVPGKPENLVKLLSDVTVVRVHKHKVRAIYIGKKSPWTVQEWTQAVAKAFEGVGHGCTSH